MKPAPQFTLRDFIATLGVVLGVLAFYRVAFGSFDGFVAAIDFHKVFLLDFENHFYPIGQSIFIDPHPPDDYYYSAFSALLFAPLGALSYENAFAIWAIFQAACMAGLWAIPAVLLWKNGRPAYYLHLAVFLLSAPVWHNFVWGQVSVPLVLGVVAGLFLYRSNRWIAAALVIALCASIKFYPGVVALIFLMRRDWRTFGFFAAACSVMIAIIPMPFIGTAETIEYHLTLVQNISSSKGWVFLGPNSNSFANVIVRCFHAIDRPDIQAIITLLQASGVVIFIACLYPIYKIATQRDDSNQILIAGLLLMSLTVFVVHSCWTHYFAYLPFIQALAVTYSLRRSARFTFKAHWPLMLAIISIFLSSMLLFILIGSWNRFSWWGSTFWANVLLLPVVIIAFFKSFDR